MADAQDKETAFPVDPIWQQHAKEIRQFAFFLTDAKTNKGQTFIIRDLYQLMGRFNMGNYSRLREFFRTIVALHEIDACFQECQNPLSTRLVQQIILRAVGLKLDDVFKAKYTTEEGKSFADYQSFYESMIAGIKALKNQGLSSPLPNLTASLTLQFVNSFNQAYGTQIKLDMTDLKKDLGNYFQSNTNFRENLITQLPKINPAQTVSTD